MVFGASGACALAFDHFVPDNTLFRLEKTPSDALRGAVVTTLYHSVSDFPRPVGYARNGLFGV